MVGRVAVLAAAVVVCVDAGSRPVSAQNGAGFYESIRTNDLAKLKMLAASAADVNTPGQFGATPLMLAAAFGSADAVRLLVAAGAGVNARNAFGATALIWAATDPEKVRLLLDAGADPNLASEAGRTPLFVAAMTAGNVAAVKMLIARGADVKARDRFGSTMLNAATMADDLDTIRLMIDAGVDVNAAPATGFSPLIAASYQGDSEAVRLLLAKGARVNAVAAAPGLFRPDNPKSGPLALANVTALLGAAPTNYETVKLLVDAGADVNARDGRNMTPLMLATATDHQDRRVIQLLIDRGADATLQSSVGETARDWARKTAAEPAIEVLKANRPQASHAAAAAAENTPKAAVEKAIALLESSSQKFFEGSGCVSCHHQNATDFAVGEARAKGLTVSATAQGERFKMLAAGPPPALLMERMDIAVPEILASSAAALAAAGAPPNLATDLIAANIAATQATDGSWRVVNGLGARPPTEDGPITRVALCIRALKVYGSPARAPELNARIARARDWLKAAVPASSEDANMQVLGLLWAGLEPAALAPMTGKIRAAQQSDGGWKQKEGLATDAYATGQSLYVLARTGALRSTDAAYQRGVAYLVGSQSENGAWRVASRAPKFQAYFNSGFPYAGDQWISAWATSWSAMALAQAVP